LVYAPIAVAHVLLHVAQVVELEAPLALLVGGRLLVLDLEGLVVDIGARTEVLLGVGEEIVGAVADQVGATDFGVGDAELRCARVGACEGLLAHELLCALLAQLDIRSKVR
jgi:hypothetical protein